MFLWRSVDGQLASNLFKRNLACPLKCMPFAQWKFKTLEIAVGELLRLTKRCAYFKCSKMWLFTLM